MTVRAAQLISYAEIRRDYQSHDLVEPVLVDHYAKIISPALTSMFVKAKLIPNSVTVLMMISGVIGAGLFAIPGIGVKVCGLIFIHLWYVMDCSDGEVARITKRFSQFGKEMDLTAHILCHPLFNLAFANSLISLGRYNRQVVLFLSILCISTEMVLRNLTGFYHIYDLKMGRVTVTKVQTNAIKQMFIHVANAFSLYPNFALLFPIGYILDWYLGTSISLYYLIAHTTIASLAAARLSFKWVRTIVPM